ncbi:palmitoyl-acyl carrier protein thioesterase, chloroplastic-like [Papaver somniferum]|uniref:palmitoyl-acyl carrier protein thioesterase, chloroplastic-like n=1 Tax=Papaver somniferum TaxID=3469 RepID=UPI000E6FD076|nr:palmitoyl-acyl carrier protein thioesterase, chloroplastic-like [Papaver somniferum]
MSVTITAALSACSPANHSLRTTLVTKISGGSDNVIPLGMKSETKPCFRGLRVTAKTQALEKIKDDCVYRGNFTIRSFEIGPNRMATIGTFLNHLQESAANHIRDIGLVGDGFNSTPEMSKRNLIWVVSKMQVIVDRYPSWGDVVEIDTWFGGAPIKNGFAMHWLLRDANTGETLAQANSVWIMMNKNTRKLSKIPEEVRDEITPHIKDYRIWDDIKLSKLHDNEADSVQTGVIAHWSDLDVNHHVNFAKYVGWILENSPIPILKSQELYDLSLEFKKECGVGDELKSLTRVVETDSHTECQHMLQFESGGEVMRGKTKWRPAKQTNVVNLWSLTK